MRTYLRGKITLLFMTCAVLLAVPAIAFADIVADSINDVNVAVGSRTIVAGDSTSVGYKIQNQNINAGDTQNNCNPADGTAANLAFSVTDVTATPNPLVINQCSTTFTPASFSSEKAGTYSITPAVTDAGGGVYQTAPATWSLTVNRAKTQLTNVSGAGVSGQSNGTLTAKLGSFKTDNTTFNKNLANKPVTFEIDGNAVPGTATTDNTGVATLTNVNLSGVSAGSHTVKALFAQDDGYLASTGTGTLTVASPPDSTPPVITKVVTPASPNGDNGWYKSGNVTVVWTVSDPESPNSIVKTGCVDQNITSDQAATTYSCSATSAGGSAGPVSVTIRRDATAPTNVAGELDRAADSNGWYNHAVNATFTGDDATSGIASCSSDGAYSGPDGTGKTVTGSCTDNAGNSANGSSPTFNYDATAPDATADADRSADQGGWYNAPFTVSFSGTDATSGNVSCDPDVNYNGPDTNSDSISGSCTDEAGNSDSATFNFKYDNTDPTINGSASPAANGNGWNNSDVTVSFECSDATSGVPAGNCPANVILSEGADQSVTRSVTDAAGNTASDTVSDINIDKTDPNVALNGGPANGQSYYFGSVPNAPTCTASDALSGLDGSCSVSGYSNAVGTHTVKATAKDKAGNTNEASSTYTVLAWTTKGFYQPVDMGGVFNTVKGGSTVPLKFELFAGDTELTATTSVKSLTYAKVNCDGSAPTDDIETVATGGTSLRYDSTGGQFIYNWKTPTGQGCYKVTMLAQDGSTISAFFKTK